MQGGTDRIIVKNETSIEVRKAKKVLKRLAGVRDGPIDYVLDLDGVHGYSTGEITKSRNDTMVAWNSHFSALTNSW